MSGENDLKGELRALRRSLACGVRAARQHVKDNERGFHENEKSHKEIHDRLDEHHMGITQRIDALSREISGQVFKLVAWIVVLLGGAGGIALWLLERHESLPH
jgi:dihydropteroate synthase